MGRPKFHKTDTPGIRRDDKGRFWVVAMVGGQKIEKLCGTKTAAKHYLASKREKFRRASLFPEEAQARERRGGLALTVRQLCDRYRREDENRNTKSDTHANQEDAWIEILGEHCTVGEVTIETITEQQSRWLSEGMAPGTINRYCARLRRVFSQATRDRVIPYNPIAGYPSLQEPAGRDRRLEREEEARLRPVLTPWEAQFLDFALLSGFRQEEQFTCRCSFVRLELNEIRLPKTKARQPRTIPMRPRLRALVEELLEQSKGGWLFPNKTGSNYMKPNNFLRRHWKPALEKADIEDLWWHDLRRTCATRLAMEGVPLAVIQEYLGHANSSTTDRYLSMAGAHLHAAFAHLDTPPASSP